LKEVLVSLEKKKKAVVRGVGGGLETKKKSNLVEKWG
jgi:hypothetical protein